LPTGEACLDAEPSATRGRGVSGKRQRIISGPGHRRLLTVSGLFFYLLGRLIVSWLFFRLLG
jgi:hypothetical protein